MSQHFEPDAERDPRLPPTVDRRGFLRMTAGGATAIAAVSLLPAGCAATYPQATDDKVKLRALSSKEYAVARAAAEALLIGVPVSASSVAHNLDVQLALVGDPIREDMKTVLQLIEHLTPLGGRFRRFTTLPIEARQRYLRTWGNSRFKLRRGAYGAVKSFVYFFAYTDRATRPLTHFPGPWQEYAKIPVRPVDFGGIA
jgi:hypothetical protein